MLTISVLFVADFVGLIPNPSEAVLNGRKQLAESLAVQCAVCAQRNDLDAAGATMQLIVERNNDIRGVTLRYVDGSILAQAGESLETFPDSAKRMCTPDHAMVPLFADEKQWGTLEIHFQEGGSRMLWRGPGRPLLTLVLFVGMTSFIGYVVFLKRALRYLDPNSVVPQRVKAALNSLVEGVVLFDKDERIVLANSAFARNAGQQERSLLGLGSSELNWKSPASTPSTDTLPWRRALHDDQALSAVPVVLSGGPEGERKLMVNAAPIHDDHGIQQGVLATFDDVTDIEEKNAELEETLVELEESQDEIRRQNEQLEELATKDSLTGCLNRRAFFARLNPECTLASQERRDLACIMVDVDHFKAINDQHGHPVGDEVLRSVAQTLRSGVRASDVVCRYGGEEFCLLLCRTDAEKALQIAEGLREQIAANPVRGIRVTASFGVSGWTSETPTPEKLIDRADKALYAAKHSGRNKVIHGEHVSLTPALPPDTAQDRPNASDGEAHPADLVPWKKLGFPVQGSWNCGNTPDQDTEATQSEPNEHTM